MDTIKIALSSHILLSVRCRLTAVLLVTTSAVKRRARRRNSSMGDQWLQEHFGRREQIDIQIHTYVAVGTHIHSFDHTLCTYEWSKIIPKQVSE